MLIQHFCFVQVFRNHCQMRVTSQWFVNIKSRPFDDGDTVFFCYLKIESFFSNLRIKHVFTGLDKHSDDILYTDLLHLSPHTNILRQNITQNLSSSLGQFCNYYTNVYSSRWVFLATKVGSPNNKGGVQYFHIRYRSSF